MLFFKGSVSILGLVLMAAAGSAQAESKIAFEARNSLAGGTYDQIFVVNADGSGLTNLSNNAFPEQGPSWSPDGSKIAFSSFRNGVHSIYVMNADGSNQTKLVDVGSDGNDIDSIAWSPELPSSVASISPFGQFVTVFILGGITALWVTGRRPQRAEG